MIRIKKASAFFMVAVILYTIIGGSITFIFADVVPVTINRESYSSGTLVINWNPSGAQAAVITYHTPDTSNNAVAAAPITVLGENRATITGLKADYIYDIRVTLYASAADIPSGEPIGRGLMFFLPSITFLPSIPDQPYDDIPGGGREIGKYPRLKLRWKVPRVFYDPDNTIYPNVDPNNSNNAFLPANQTEAKTYMENALNGIYMDGKDLAVLNYKINISTDLNILNSGSNQAAVIISQDPADASLYTANVSGNNVEKAIITQPDSQGYISLELWGRTDESSTVPPLPVDSGGNVLEEYKDTLRDPDILPGTVYYMNIKPYFRNAVPADVAAFVFGKQEDQGGSLLSGERPYTSTPIRFQLTKDSANNIYVKIFRLNQGSLQLPQLYYEVQATDLPSTPGDWVIKKTMDDSFFSGEYALTVIQGVNPNNDMHYKIVVKSGGADDRLESLAMPYRMTTDTSRPPLPMGIALNGRTLHVQDVTKPDDGSPPPPKTTTVKSTDIKLSWDKPLNWDTIKNDLAFHFLLSTNQTETTRNLPIYVNGEQWGDKEYKAKYRRIKYISALSPKIKEVGNRLEYTLDAFELFQWEMDIDSDPDMETGSIPLDANDTDYPTFLIPNTVYYLQMFTTKTGDAVNPTTEVMSDRSVIVSFTTLGDVDTDVPLPMSFEMEANGRETVAGNMRNYIDLRFDKVSTLDWRKYTSTYNELEYSYNIYYDLYMNSRTDTQFFPIGTTQIPSIEGDVGFTGANDPQSTSVRARISSFTEESAEDLVDCGLLPDTSRNAVNLFGEHLQPNTTYYFIVKTRLVIQNRTDPADRTIKESISTAIVPVTTILLDVTGPDDSLRKPLAPTDFDIAVNSNGNQMLSGSSVTFTWTRQENDVIYQLIRTTNKINPTDGLSVYENDPEYESFLQTYDILSDGVVNNAVYLDPAPALGDPATHPGKFTYDPVTKICTYTVDQRMFPNKLYYFSLKAVRVDASRDLLVPSPDSVWVSIPVTTSLIDAPSSLEVVLNAELGFYWTDATAGMTAEDYKIYVKGPSDGDFRLMTRSQATIVKDNDGKTYYGRVMGLKTNSLYDIRVVKGSDTLIYEKSSLQTRDGFHELEVRWVGIPLDDYASYEIALMEEGGSEYTVLTAADLQLYTDKNNSVLPYYSEESARTINTDSLYYYARIKSVITELPGGIVTSQPLRSNVKYYIKVRAVKIDPTETDLISYSKYIGPVNTRTEFNQDDYDNTDREEQQKAVFLDKMASLEKGYYWRVAMGSSQATAILLKGERVSDAMRNSTGDTFTVDMTGLSVNISKDEVYIPISVIRTMNQLNRSLLIRTAGAELTLRPTTLDASVNEQIKSLLSKKEVADLYVRLIITRSLTSPKALPSNQLRVSDINELDIYAMGLSTTDGKLAKMFHDRLYDKDNGLVSEKLIMLQNAYVGSGSGSKELVSKYTQNLVNMIEEELSVYIDNTLKNVRLANSVSEINTFEAPGSVNLFFNSSDGMKIPYTLYDGSAQWQKVTVNADQLASSVRFNLLKTGKYVILTARSTIGGVPEGHWAESYITSLASKYDLGNVFPGIQNSFMPDNKVMCKEVVLLYELVVGRSAELTGLEIRQKSEKLGLDSLIHPNSLVRNVQRQQTAAVLLKLLSVKKGVNMASLRPGGRIIIADESSINEEYFHPVLMIVDLEVMGLDGNGRFSPGNQMTRAEVVTAFVKLLELTGDL